VWEGEKIEEGGKKGHPEGGASSLVRVRRRLQKPEKRTLTGKGQKPGAQALPEREEKGKAVSLQQKWQGQLFVAKKVPSRWQGKRKERGCVTAAVKKKKATPRPTQAQCCGKKLGGVAHHLGEEEHPGQHKKDQKQGKGTGLYGVQQIRKKIIPKEKEEASTKRETTPVETPTAWTQPRKSDRLEKEKKKNLTMSDEPGKKNRRP